MPLRLKRRKRLVDELIMANRNEAHLLQ